VVKRDTRPSSTLRLHHLVDFIVQPRDDKASSEVLPDNGRRHRSRERLPDSAKPQLCGSVVVSKLFHYLRVKPVLQKHSLTVHRLSWAETRIILGRAAGGKSVLMKLANGPSFDPTQAPFSRSSARCHPHVEGPTVQTSGGIGMVFQESALFDPSPSKTT